MCTVCGCGDAGHDHGHGHHHHHFGHGPAGTAVAGMSQSRLVEIETSILAKNDAFAWENRAWLNRQGWFAVNLMSSPGSGKTSLLVATIGRMAGPVAVIEGDQQTQNDADRIRATGAPAVQINTGKGCHLDAHMVAHALADLPRCPATTLFIENVGNLVCPAGFDLGEDARVVLFSVTEGEDKPLKYPEMFTNCDLAILTKTDLAPHCEVDLALCEANLRRVNPRVAILRLSARTGEGMAGWTQWLADQAAAKAKRLAAE